MISRIPIYPHLVLLRISAVVESRRIFRKLKSYVIYRFAATIQIVLVLSLVIYISNCPINSLYVILLALFNDITMLPIAYDKQHASKTPETPEVSRILLLSFLLGAIETALSLLFAYGASETGLFDDNYDLPTCDTTIQAAVWLQMSIAGELLIFSARAPTFMFLSISPSVPLTVSVLCGCVVTSLLAGLFDMFGGLSIKAILLIWAYDIMGLIVIDICKVGFLRGFNESQEVLDDSSLEMTVAEDQTVDVLMGAHRKSKVRLEAASDRLSEWDSEMRKSYHSKASEASYHSCNFIQDEISSRERTKSGGYSAHAPRTPSRDAPTRVVAREPYGATVNSVAGRTSLVSGDLRPNTPGNRKLR